MTGKIIPLTQFSSTKKGKITSIEGGHGLQRKLRVMGLREGQIVRIVSKQPFKGPLTISTGNNHMTLGRGMANKIIVEEL